MEQGFFAEAKNYILYRQKRFPSPGCQGRPQPVRLRQEAGTGFQKNTEGFSPGGVFPPAIFPPSTPLFPNLT